MGQKINPISLRLASSTKIYDSFWYNDYFYTKLLSFDLYVNRYLNDFFKLMKLPSIRLTISHLPQSVKLYNFFCYPRESRESKLRIFQVSTSLPSLKNKKNLNQKNISKKKNFFQILNDRALWEKLNLLKKNGKSEKKKQFQYSSLQNIPTSFLKNQTDNLKIQQNSLGSQQKNALNSKQFSFQLWKNLLILKTIQGEKTSLSNSFHEFSMKIFFKDFFHLLSKQKLIHQFSGFDSIKNKNKIFLFLNLLNNKNFSSLTKYSNQEKLTATKIKYKNYLENHLSQVYNINVQLVPFKVFNEWQSANYFADEIVYYLERRVSFRRLKTKILKQVSQNKAIRGIRITCSGRVGGKSKKAQRAKIESIKYGQTSLHVFSSRIDFAVKTASTSLGSTGIKVWICYN